MTKKYHTFYGIGGLIVGVIGGIAGAAFSMGAEQQHIKESLIKSAESIETMKTNNTKHETLVQKEMDRYGEIITVQMTSLYDGIAQLTNTVSNLRTDVAVLKALMERMEEDFQNRSNSD